MSIRKESVGRPGARVNDLLLAAALFLAAVTVFWPMRGHEFIRLDDTVYVVENPVVLRGLTLSGFRWAMTTFHASNWHPLTWLSHMLDVELFGTAAGGHHLTSLVLHAFSTALLFAAMLRLTGLRWHSAAVAFLFGVHPLHVESVAWVAERKDVLSTFFGMLTLLAYRRYVARPNAGRYLLTASCMALGLMAKPMLVTLPFVLILLDYWPLGRLRAASKRTCSPPGPAPARVVAEKIPLLVLSAASGFLTVLAQRQDAIRTFNEYAFAPRVANAVVSYLKYLALTFRPTRLIYYYEYPRSGWSTPEIVGASAVLLALSMAAVLLMQRRPYLFTGWFWYLGTLVPVIGIVQVGGQSMADRYTYFPLIGVFAAGIWFVAAMVPRGNLSRFATAASWVLLAGTLAMLTRKQLVHWRDEVTLQRHVLSVEPDNYLALENLGTALVRQGNIPEGQEYLDRAYRQNPFLLADVHLATGRLLAREGRREEALFHLRKALEIDPSSEDARVALQSVQQGRADRIREQFRELVAAGAVDAATYHRQGLLLAWEGLYEEALEPLLKAVSLQPDLAEAHSDLGVTYVNLRQYRDATDSFERALAIRPDLQVPRQQLVELRKFLGQ